MAEEGSQQKMLTKSKDLILKEWDISFAISGETLINVLNFTMEINTEVPMKFYDDKIFLSLKSPDSAQYAEVEINSTDVLDYKPNIRGEHDRKDAKSIIKGTDGDFKPILFDVKGTIDEIESFAQKDDIVIIRVDTFYYRKIEFHCSNNMIIWAQLIDPSTILKTIERLPEIIKNVRNDPKIKKASAIVEPATFTRILAIGGKEKKRDIDKRVYIELDKKDGIFISSGDRLKGRIFELKPTDLGRGDAEEYGAYEDAYVPDVEEESVVATVEEEEPGFAPSSYTPKEEKKEKRGEKKKFDRQTDQLLSIEVDAPQHVYFDKEFLSPFSKLKGLSPIVIEVRTNKPIVLEQRPYNGIRAMLSIAPRIENEEDK